MELDEMDDVNRDKVYRDKVNENRNEWLSEPDGTTRGRRGELERAVAHR